MLLLKSKGIHVVGKEYEYRVIPNSVHIPDDRIGIIPKTYSLLRNRNFRIVQNNTEYGFKPGILQNKELF